MNREDQETALRWAFREEHATPLFHGHVETRLEGLEFRDVLRAGISSEVLEEETRPQGRTKLLLGFLTDDDPVHIVVNVQAFESDFAEPLRVVTVYRPERPKWQDERTRRMG
jgi:hypothetical protein